MKPVKFEVGIVATWLWSINPNVRHITFVTASSDLADELLDIHIDFSYVSMPFQATPGEVRWRWEDDEAAAANYSTTRQNWPAVLGEGPVYENGPTWLWSKNFW